MDLKSFVGTPYRDGGRGPDAYDCLGLFLAVQRECFGRDLPDPAVLPWDTGHDDAHHLLRNEAQEVTRIQAGDALLYRMTHDYLHVATAISARDMIHTSKGVGCTIEPISAPRWRARFIGAYRID